MKNLNILFDLLLFPFLFSIIFYKIKRVGFHHLIPILLLLTPFSLYAVVGTDANYAFESCDDVNTSDESKIIDINSTEACHYVKGLVDKDETDIFLFRIKEDQDISYTITNLSSPANKDLKYSISETSSTCPGDLTTVLGEDSDSGIEEYTTSTPKYISFYIENLDDNTNILYDLLIGINGQCSRDDIVTFDASKDLDIVDTYNSTTYIAPGPVIKTKISLKSEYTFDAVYLGYDQEGAEEYNPLVGSHPLPVLFYPANEDCSIKYEWAGDLPVGVAEIAIGESYAPLNYNATLQAPAFAKKDMRLRIESIDWNSLIGTLSISNTCAVSSTTGNLCGVMSCLGSSTQAVDAFPINTDNSSLNSNNRRIMEDCYGLTIDYATDNNDSDDTVNGNIIDTAPCQVNNYNGNCGGDKDGSPIYPEKYDHPYGCLACILDSDVDYGCSKDNFALRPDKFDANITLTEGKVIAGSQTPISFKALDANTTPGPTFDYNETEPISFVVDINISDPTKKCQNQNINMTPNVDFTHGIDPNDKFVFHDIGDVNMTTHEINGSEFAFVDRDDTNDTLRLIGEFNTTFSIIPARFIIDANLTDHNSDHNFTYLHDINIANDRSMASTLTIYIKAVGETNETTHNYTEECYEKNTTLILDLNETNITYPGSIPALTQFLYYNPEENDPTLADSGEGNYSLAPLTDEDNRIITISFLPIENNASFPDDGDVNGTTYIEYKLNFDRKQNLLVNPFKLVLSDANITDTDDVYGEDTALDQKSTTLYYARASSSLFFYEHITEDTATTPITVNIYCDFSDSDDCLISDTDKARIDEMYWWLSLGHDGNNVNGGDGNITIKVGSPLIEPEATVATDQDINDVTYSSGNAANIIIVSTDNGVKDDVNVSRGSDQDPPLTVPLELVKKDDLSAPPYTNEWLIYNKYHPTDRPSPFYKVRFIGEAEWTGEGVTGYVMDINASYKKTKRLDW